MPENLLDRLRDVALALPEVTEKISHKAPAFYLRKRAFCRFHELDYNGDGRIALWCQAEAGVAADMAASEPHRFFQPQPSAGGVFESWLGVYLDTTGANAVDWDEIAAILADAYRQVAPKKLIAQMESNN